MRNLVYNAIMLLIIISLVKDKKPIRRFDIIVIVSMVYVTVHDLIDIYYPISSQFFYIVAIVNILVFLLPTLLPKKQKLGDKQ